MYTISVCMTLSKAHVMSHIVLVLVGSCLSVEKRDAPLEMIYVLNSLRKHAKQAYDALYMPQLFKQDPVERRRLIFAKQ